nr:hypothetical protein BaRGS_022613 [Batillaria attramentaria]
MASLTVELDIRDIQEDTVLSEFDNVNVFVGTERVRKCATEDDSSVTSSCTRQPTLTIPKCTDINVIICKPAVQPNLTLTSDFLELCCLRNRPNRTTPPSWMMGYKFTQRNALQV